MSIRQIATGARAPAYLRGGPSMCVLLAGACFTAGLFLGTASIQAQQAGRSSNGGLADDERLQPYVIEGPSRPALRRAPSFAPKTVDETAEPVPAPAAVARPKPAPAQVALGQRRGGAAGCANPNALGVAREVEIDTQGGPKYGFQQYKLIDFLQEGEIVLTFDDGPAPAYTNPILQALEHHCTKATFFIVGRNALAYPEVVRDEHARGHTIANHTWSHANLGMRRIVPKRTPQAADGVPGSLSLAGPSPQSSQPSLTTSSVAGHAGDPFGGDPAAPLKPVFAPAMSPEKAKAEIELGFSATARALGVPMAPFFRFPYLGNSTAMQTYLAERNVAIFSIDVDSVDYRAKKAEDVINRVMADLKDQKKGILLFHDIQPATAQAMPAMLDLLHAKGYRVVHIKPKTGLQTIAAFDARVGKDGVRQDAIAEKKPLAKRTVTWGMAPSGSQPGETSTGPARAARADDAYRPQVAARKPASRPDSASRSDVPGYMPPGYGQPEVLPWLSSPQPRRRPDNGW